MQDNTTFLTSVVGIVTKTGETLAQLMKQKKWLPMLIVVLALTAIITYITLPIEMARMADNEILAQQVPEGGLVQLGNLSVGKRILVSTISIFAITFVLAVGAFFIYLFFGIGGAEGYYVNYFTLTVNASLFDVVLPLLLQFAGLLLYVDLVGVGRLVNWLPASTLNPTGFTYMLLGHIDLFSIAYMTALAMGVSVFAKMKIKKCAIIAVLYFTFKALVGSAFYYLLAKATGPVA